MVVDDVEWLNLVLVSSHGYSFHEFRVDYEGLASSRSTEAAVGGGCGVLFQFEARKCCECFLLGGGSQDVACGEVFGLWVCGAANAVGGLDEIVAGVPELNIGIE